MIFQVSPNLDSDELDLLSKTITNAWLTEGPFTEKFIDQIKNRTGAKYALPVNNGTLGLYLALLALDLPKHSEIIIPTFTFFGSVSSAHFAGLKPIFVDVSTDDYMLNASQIEAAITPKTSAIMPVHIYGQSVDLDPIITLAKKYDLRVIEDAAQAMGVLYKGKHCGTLGDVGVISFFADKTITMGEGGVVLTNHEDLYNKLKLIRNQGRPNSGTFIHPEFGMNFRITDMQAAIGLAQLIKLDEIIEKKKQCYSWYEQSLQDIDGINQVKKQPYSSFVPFRYFFTCALVEEVTKALEVSGIQTRRFFYPMHKQPSVIKHYGVQTPLPNAELLYSSGLCLPVHQNITPSIVDKIVTSIHTIYN